MPVSTCSFRNILTLKRRTFLFTIFLVLQHGTVATYFDASEYHTSLLHSQFPTASLALKRPTSSRKLLDLDRIGDKCTLSDITILQGEASPLPDGIPTYTVQIFNSCTVGCPLSDVHIFCGWWATTKLVNPSVFKRLKFNDCLVNDGKPLKPGELLTFQYANSFQYPMSVKSVTNSCI